MAESEVGTAVEPDLTHIAEGLQRTLTRLFSILRRGDAPRAASTAGDLTLAQLSILVTLLEVGPIRMTELAARERVRTPTTTVAIRRLEKLGLVKRTRDATDLRAVLVEITPKGHAEHRESLDHRHAMIVELIKALSPEDIAALDRAIGPLERLGLGAPDKDN